jgi:hypothetical protein
VGILDRLFGTEPVHVEAPTGTADVFQFKESLVAMGPQSTKHVCAPGQIKCEVVNDAGEVLAMDTFKAPKKAPRGAWTPHEDHPATFVVVPVGPVDCAQQEVTVPLAYANQVVRLPDHLTEKPGASHVRIWWSCEDE